MKLVIDNYRISRLDEHNILLEQYTKLNPRNPYGRNGNNGKQKKVAEGTYKYIRVGYYPNITDALNKLINHKLLQGEGETTAQEILSSLAELKQEIMTQLHEEFEPQTA
tara:strand:- start:3033 stop:3359 length:327 start_codon:yes stop_codon:yes gene_type:complete